MKTLIINLGPAGDVLRTTALLRELKGEIFWLTKLSSKDVLNSKKITKLYFLKNFFDIQELKNQEFNLIISLNEEKEALNLLKELKTKKLIGVYLNKEGEIEYTPESSYWFDMSLSSKFGKQKADLLKIKNKKSYMQILIEMIGKKWKAQEYDLGIKPLKVKGKIGIIKINIGLWPNKRWAGYEKLAYLLKKEGKEVFFLPMRLSIKEHINDINNCELIICGDTLGMHIALALQKKVIALFNCTSPNEIYDYGRLVKIISPFYKKYFYKKEFHEEAINAIKVEQVYKAVKKLLNE